MATKCTHCPLRQRDTFVDLTDEEVRFMSKFKAGELSVDAGTQLLMEGSNSPQLYTVLHGMGLRYKVTGSGRRQVVNFVMPGDFLGLQAGIMGEMGHSVEATTRMTLCLFNRSDFWAFFKAHPDRAFDITWLAAVEEHFMGEALTAMGQRSALESVAWALCRVYMRGESLGLAVDGTMALPYKQQDLADALGLSLVHTNKTLAKLRERQMASWSDGHLQINDLEGLVKLSDIDDTKVRPRPII